MSDDFKPGPKALIVGVNGLMQRYGVGEKRARRWLREWRKAMLDGGPPAPRVFTEKLGNRTVYLTTEAELHAHNPRMRDQQLLGKVNRLEKELETERDHISRLTTEMRELRAWCGRLASQLERRR